MPCLLQTLSQLLEFSNRAVQHLIEDIVLDSELSLVNWPAPELVQISDLKFPPTDWNSTDYQLKVQYVSFFFLHEISLDWYNLCVRLWRST